MSKFTDKLYAVGEKIVEWMFPMSLFTGTLEGWTHVLGTGVASGVASIALSAASTYVAWKFVTEIKQEQGWDESRAVIARLEKEKDQLESQLLQKEREQRRKEDENHSLTTQLQKTIAQQQKRANQDRSLITHLQKAEKIKEAKESGDKLAIKSAVLDQASAPERHKREDAIARMTEKGAPLSQINVQRLRDQEEKKRLKVNKGLLQNKQGR